MPILFTIGRVAFVRVSSEPAPQLVYQNGQYGAYETVANSTGLRS